MGAMPQAVLEFDDEVQAPWRPRLVPVGDVGHEVPSLPRRPQAARRSPSRVGACRPGEPAVRPGLSERRGSGPGVRGSAPRASSARAGRSRRPVSVRPGVRLTRRARRLAVALLLASGVALGSWLGPLLHSGGDLRLAGVNSVVVQPGDTLWSIAGSLEGDDDVRGVVDAIQALNGLEGSDIAPGEVLILP
jgi:nucleoid-associated protein YgaU